jgi:ribosome biogenesis GTPase / thiamine phosphate phosphatase
MQSVTNSDVHPSAWPIGYRAECFSTPELGPNELIARLIEQHRTDFVMCAAGRDNFRAEAHPKLKQLPSAQRPAVGDFVLIEPGQQYFTRVMPRYCALKRAAAGEKYAEQVLAANIDRAIIVCGMDRDFSPRRVERYLALVRGCGVEPTIVLSKADTHPDAQQVLQSLRERLPLERIHAIDTRAADQVDWLRAELPENHTGVLLGSSGAGKSTLSNTLANASKMATGAVRRSDGRGRHTTVHRALLQLPWGACLIDSPGLREIKLAVDDAETLASFGDIDELALQCRFRDCSHQREPDCAVLAAVDQGVLLDDRLASYQKLIAERDHAFARQNKYGSNKLARR